MNQTSILASCPVCGSTDLCDLENYYYCEECGQFTIKKEPVDG